MATKNIKNMEEFAAVSGISRPTISKYFQDPDSVRSSTKERIEAALEKYQYRPNMYAINQNRRLTKNIGIVVPFLADPYFSEISRKIENRVIEAGYRPILLSSHGGADHEIDNLDSLRSIKPAGVLLAPLGRASDKLKVAEFCDDVPTILFDCHLEGIGEAFFGHNNAQATRLICDYLCRSGEPPVLFEMRTPANPNSNRRRVAYIEALEDLGHEPQVIKAEGTGWDFEAVGYREGHRVLAEGLLSTNTVLCSNDRLAIGFLAAAYESGRRVGLEADCVLRVAGHDDHPFSRYTCPSLTTVSHDYESIASQSVESLMSLISDGHAENSQRVTLYDGHLVLRNSA